MAQLMPLPVTVSCFSKIQIGSTFLVPAHLGSPGKRSVKWVCVSHRVVIVCFSGQSSREDGKGLKSRKLSTAESAEKTARRKDGGSKPGDSRLLPGVDDGATKESASRGKTEVEPSSGSARHTKTDSVGMSPGDVGTRDKRKPAADPREKSSASKSQHKTKDSVSAEKRSGEKAAEGSGKRKPRTESTSSGSSDSSSSSSSSSGTSSSGSSSSSSSSTSEASASKKPPRKQRTTAKSKSDVQRAPSGGSKTRGSKPAAKSADKVESGKPSGKESGHRSREKGDDGGQKEYSSSRGSGRWKEEKEVEDRHRVGIEGRKEGRRSGRDEKTAEYSPQRRSRDEDVERHATPSGDRRLQPHDSSVDHRQDRMSARYPGDHRRSGRYDVDDHYDRIQHPADFEVGDRYRAG